METYSPRSKKNIKEDMSMKKMKMKMKMKKNLKILQNILN